MKKTNSMLFKKKNQIKAKNSKKQSRWIGGKSAKFLGVPLMPAIFALSFACIGLSFLIITHAASVDFTAETRQIQLTNERHTDLGIQQLKTSGCLTDLARYWSQHMAETKADDGTGPGIHHTNGKYTALVNGVPTLKTFHANDPGLANLLNFFCPSGGYWTGAGENIGRGYDSDGLFDSFVNSTCHRANIDSLIPLDLNYPCGSPYYKPSAVGAAGYNFIGTGAYRVSSSSIYMTVLFATCSGCTGDWTRAATLSSPVVTAAPTGNGYFMRNSNTGGAANFSFNYGKSTDVSLLCDWNGDGKTTAGVFRAGTFYLTDTNSTANYVFTYGNSDDIPICGDWNGDGKDTVGVYRPSTAKFYMRNANSGGTSDISFAYGNIGDKPVIGDWNGDGKDTIGVYRESTFYLRNSNSAGAVDISFSYGTSTDKPLAGDWNGDGKDTVGVYRPSTAKFYMRNTNSSGTSDLSFAYGVVGDKPVVGDWDGNGTTTIGIRR